MVLGVTEDADYREDVVQLETGDCLVLYTDGVLDAASATERFGEERLLDALTGTVASPQAAIERRRDFLRGWRRTLPCGERWSSAAR